MPGAPVPQRIVVVEDEPIVGLDIKLHLQSFGYIVDGVYATGEEALKGIALNPPDIAIMDIRLQGMFDGLETAEQVKAKYGIPIILLTAHADEDTLKRARDSAPFGYIMKPFEPRELRTAVEIALLRHQMEQAVIQRERLFSTTLESIRDAVIVVGPEFRIEYVNTVAQKLLRGSREALLGAKLHDHLTLLGPDGSTVGNHDTPGIQVFAQVADGTQMPVDRYSSALVDENGVATGWVIVLHDVSEHLESERILREHEERARQSQKMEAIGRLTGGIAHDFNNLLTVIMGYARLLVDELNEMDQGKEVDTAALRADADGIRKAAGRSAELTRQLLAFSRHQIMQRSVVDLNAIVSGMQKMLERLVSDDITLQFDLVASPSSVYADPGQLEQVLMNLVVNARDAMHSGGRVVVKTENRTLGEADIEGRHDVQPGEFICLTVRDSGIGMDGDTLEHIFEPFFTTKQPGEGTGLGLSTVYGIVAQSGGAVDVRSQVGGGSQFSVWMPYHADAPTVASSDGAKPHSPLSGHETILVVEDDDAVRLLLVRTLGRSGYQVLEAANAGEALLQWENARDTIAMIVTDVVMPHLPGTKLIARLRVDDPDLKVLFLSGYPDKYADEAELTDVAHHFMQKPVDPREVVKRVRRILDE
ncbi:MAG: response regulator [Spirochaetales bacterium]|nr:MAG: response regulator [Spirochaetales bacterium]